MKRIILIVYIFICIIAFGKEELILGTLEYPPYIEQTNNNFKGLAVDIINESFNRMGIKVKYVMLPIARSLKMLEDGEIDGFFSIKKTPEREGTLIFPNEFLFSQDYVFFVKKYSKIYFDGNYDSIKNATIGIVNSVSYGARFDKALKNGEFKKTDLSNNFESTFKKLLNGRVDIVICSKLVGLAILKNLDALEEIQITGLPSETTVSYIAFTKKTNYSELSKKFDNTIKKMKEDGTLKKILKKYEK